MTGGALGAWLRGAAPTPNPPADPRFAALSLAQLRRCALRPRRPRLALVSRVLAGATSGAAAWERLANEGLVPGGAMPRQFADTVDRRARQFTGRVGGPGPTIEWDTAQARALHDPHLPDRPPSVAAARALASDPEGVTLCESLALEFVARASAVALDEAPERLVWAFYAPERQPPSPYDSIFRDELFGLLGRGRNVRFAVVDDTLHSMGTHPGHRFLEPRERERAHYDAVGPSWGLRLEDDLVMYRAWQRLARFEVAVDAHRGAPAHGSRSYADLADPFDPLLRIWACGYALLVAAGGTLVLSGREVG